MVRHDVEAREFVVKVVDIRDPNSITLIEHLLPMMLETEELKGIDLEAIFCYYTSSMVRGRGRISVINNNSGKARSYIFYRVAESLYGTCLVIEQVYSGRPGDGIRLVRHAEQLAKRIGVSSVVGQVSTATAAAKCRLFGYEAESVLIRRNL